MTDALNETGKINDTAQTSETEEVSHLKLGFVRGVAPDKWKKRWHEVRYRRPLELLPINAFDDPVRQFGDLDLVRVQEGSRPESSEVVTSSNAAPRHAVELYTELLAVVFPKDHELAKEAGLEAEDLTLFDLVGYPSYDSRWPAPIKFADPSWAPSSATAALELVAAGVGATILPIPLARAITSKHDHRIVPVTGLPATTIFAAWPVASDSNEIQELIGVLRGRRSSSSRNSATDQEEEAQRKHPTEKTSKQKASPSRASQQKSSARKPSRGGAGRGPAAQNRKKRGR